MHDQRVIGFVDGGHVVKACLPVDERRAVDSPAADQD